jgi:uncharacterized membrane protein YeiH
MINQVPAVLVSDFYGSIALIVGIMLAGLNYFDAMSDLAILGVGLASILLRLIAYKKKWQLPKIS